MLVTVNHFENSHKEMANYLHDNKETLDSTRAGCKECACISLIINVCGLPMRVTWQEKFVNCMWSYINYVSALLYHITTNNIILVVQL